MDNNLKKAKTLAESVRFSEDLIGKDVKENFPILEKLKSFNYTNALHISPDVTPSLHKSLNLVYERLAIPSEAIQAFVFSSPEIMADCYPGDKKECIIRFSSALIDILDEEEFQFVAGHELGHFLLSHGALNAGYNNKSLEHFMQLRAQEISADRIGLNACNSLDVAIKALMKIMSGLTSRFIRFDVGHFLAQLQKTSTSSFINSEESTHPSILIRCRALLWYSLNDINQESQEINLKKLDKKIQDDLNKYIDGSAKEQINNAKINLAMWTATFNIVQEKKFTKKAQKEFSNKFGNDMLISLINFMDNIDSSEIENEIYKKLKEARDDLERLAPLSFESEISKFT